jgi:ABC-type multidrug transport system fused ATPase/permease subunit
MPSANIISSGLMQLRYSRHPISLLHADLNELEQIDLNIKAPLTPIKAKNDFRDFVLKGINFSYPNIKSPALKNLSLKIRNGESIGLIGPSGSGKTTLVDVLLGLLEPQKGEVYYNGIPLKDSLSEWRSQIAYLPQQVFLIDATLRQNVALGMEDKEIDDLQVKKALHQSRLDDLVEQLPQGVETLLGERGIRLSGGQRQRVALARAFYYGRKVLVMDEATSSLDNETELEIVEEIKHLKGKISMIVIAHRLTTVQDCDQIYKLKNGQIVDSGDYGKVVLDQIKTA